MKSKVFGVLVAGVVSGVLAAGTATASDKKAAAAGKCVHSCKGLASCKGEGSETCKGHNECAGKGLAPKECTAKVKKEACEAVKGKDTKAMCHWSA